MSKRFSFILFLLVFLIVSCDRDKEIRQLLNSKNPNDIIEGANKAGQTHEKKYVPLLLNNAADPRVATDLHFKGFSVYTEKMYALQDILHVKPPHHFGHILEEPDSVNIKFYNDLWQSMNKTN
jgi:hypothetical protein